MPRTTTQGERVSFAMQVPRPASTPQGSALRTVSQQKSPRNQRAREWQTEAYVFTWAIGEVGYIHNLTANTVASCDITVRQRVNGEVVDTSDERALRVDRAFTGPRGGKKELMRRAVLNRRIAGETWLLGTPSVDPLTTLPGDSPGLLWEFLSCRELTTDSAGQMRRKTSPAAGQMGEILDEANSYVSRWWQSDPEFSSQPDCAMRRAIPICRELLALTQVIDGTIKSRLSADMLAMPDSMSFANEENYFDNELEGGDEDIDPFNAILLDHMSAPIEDQTSAASLVPIVVRGDADDIEKIRLIGLGRDLGAWAKPLRDEALQRLGQALDSPPEMIKGMAALNHWTGFAVDSDFATKQVIPEGEDLAEFLTVSYLRPMLVVFEGMSEEEAETFTYEFDPSNILARADAGTTALALLDKTVIGRQAAARLNNVPDTDVLTDEELAVEMLRAIALSNPQLLPQLAPFIPGMPTDLPALEAAPSQPVPPAPTQNPTPPDSGGGEPTPPQQQRAAAALAEVANREMLGALERIGTGAGPLADQWLILRAEAANILIDHLKRTRQDRDDASVIQALQLMVGLMTAHTEQTRGAETYTNGLHVPDELMLPVVEVACGRHPR